MLKELIIHNYLLINDLTLEFSDGFTLITGETGAGKSILVGAVGLLLGDKTDGRLLFNPAKKCVVEGSFYIEKLNIQSFFQEEALDYLPTTILRREILPETNRSRAFINDTPVSNTQLKALGMLLIDIHSQHETLKLNNPITQLQIIDQYSRLETSVIALKQLFHSIKKQKNILEENIKQLSTAQREQEFRIQALQELTSANIKPNETKILEEEYQLLSNADALKTWLEKICYLCNEQEPSIVSMLEMLKNEGEKLRINNEIINQIIVRLQAISIELEDIVGDAHKMYEHTDHNSEQLQQLEVRLNLINGLIFKYHVQNCEQLLELIEEYRMQADNVELLEKNVSELQEQIAENEQQWNKLAVQLQSERKKTLPEIEQLIINILKQLGMPEAQFLIKHELSETPTEYGLDKITFLFSANKGLQPDEIRTIASGGELSRIMFALKKVMSHTLRFPTMVFDEIDTGISGSVAAKMGEMLQSLSKDKQLIVITHLPTVAAFANRHLYVSKQNDTQSTQINVRYLTPQERIQELAVMLSGDYDMKEAVNTAAKLIETSTKTNL